MLLKLSKFFPKKYAKLYHDYVGLMAGKLKNDTNKIVLCLDFDEEVFSIVEKMEVKPDLILTHHPFIYGKKRFVLKNDFKKAELYNKIVELNIPVYSMHTNFDSGKFGMNDALCDLLNLNNVIQPLGCPMMRIGELGNDMPINDFSHMAIKNLNVDYGLLIHKGKDTIKKVAIIGGGGSRDFVTAKNLGADIFISGDAPHHVRRDIVNEKFNYLDVPHEVERVFMPRMEEILLSIDKNLKIIKINHEEEPEVILL